MKTALVTGGTKGIGRACVKLLHGRGWAVTAVARTAADLKALQYQFPEVRVLCADLSTEAGISAIPAKDYDLLVFNAAAYRPGGLLEAADTFAELLPLNILGHHRLARRLLPPLLERGRGHLVVIGSTGTDNWKPYMTAYVATKYALRGLFLGWEQELAGTGVLATLVAPGATLTSSWDNETPPPDILAPETVAEVVWQAVATGRGGRITVT